MLIEDELRELGYDSVEIVATESDAIASAAELCPDLIIADQRLSQGSGVDAISAICSDRRIPFVFITSYRSEVREALSGAVVVGKPFWPPTLKDAIAHAVGVSRIPVEKTD